MYQSYMNCDLREASLTDLLGRYDRRGHHHGHGRYSTYAGHSRNRSGGRHSDPQRRHSSPGKPSDEKKEEKGEEKTTKEEKGEGEGAKTSPRKSEERKKSDKEKEMLSFQKIKVLMLFSFHIVGSFIYMQCVALSRITVVPLLVATLWRPPSLT